MKRFYWSLAWGWMFAATASAQPPQYTATVLPQLDTTDSKFKLTFTTPNGMNNAREVTGDVGTGLGFVWSPKTGGELLQPQFADEATRAIGNAINNGGDVAGVYAPTSGGSAQAAFVFTAMDAFIPLPTLGAGLNAGASDTNDAGLVVGAAETSSGGMFGGPTAAVYWLNGKIVNIGGLGGDSGGATAVNNNGVIVGASNAAPQQAEQPFRWTEKGGFEPLPQLIKGVPSSPNDINDNGLIVGRGGLSLFANQAVYWTPDKQIHPLDGLHMNPLDIGVLAVNNDAVMVGFEINPDTFEFEARLWIDDVVYHLQDFVTDLPEGMRLQRATDVNDFGDIIVEAAAMDGDQVEFVSVLLSPVAMNIADLNGDGFVNGADLAILLTNWGHPGPADFDESGAVDGADLAVLLTNWSPEG